MSTHKKKLDLRRLRCHYYVNCNCAMRLCRLFPNTDIKKVAVRVALSVFTHTLSFF
jgi:hypothetical protein